MPGLGEAGLFGGEAEGTCHQEMHSEFALGHSSAQEEISTLSLLFASYVKSPMVYEVSNIFCYES